MAHETLRAVAPTCYGVHVCLHKDVVQCVINRLLSCPCDAVFVSGALRWVAAKKVTTPPSPEGQHPASRHTRHLLPTSWAPMQKGVPDLLVLSPFSILWIATAVGCQSTHARLRSPSRGEQPALLQLALLEPETAAGNRPRVYKSPSSPRPLQATSPASSKAVATQKLEHLGTTSPTVNQPSPFSNVKTKLSFKACTA